MKTQPFAELRCTSHSALPADSTDPQQACQGLRPQSVLLLHLFREMRIFEHSRRRALLSMAGAL